MLPDFPSVYRLNVVEKIKESQQFSLALQNVPAREIEVQIYLKSDTNDEYLDKMAKILYHLRKSQQPPNVNATSNGTTLPPAHPESKQINQGAVGVGQVGVTTQDNVGLQSGQEHHNQMMGSAADNNIKMAHINKQRPINQIVPQHMMPRNRQALNQQIRNSRINIMAQRPQRAQSHNGNMTPQLMNEVGEFHGVIPKNPRHGETHRMNGMVMRTQKKMKTNSRQMPRFVQPRALYQFPSDHVFISQRPTQCAGSPIMNHISPHQRTSITPCSPFDSVVRQESVSCPSSGCDSRTPFPTRVLDTSRPHMQQSSVSEELTPYDKIYIEMVNHLKRKYADTFNNIRRKLPQDYSEMDRFALEMWKILENPQKMVPIPTLGHYDRVLESTGQRLKEIMNS